MNVSFIQGKNFFAHSISWLAVNKIVRSRTYGLPCKVMNMCLPRHTLAWKMFTALDRITNSHEISLSHLISSKPRKKFLIESQKSASIFRCNHQVHTYTVCRIWRDFTENKTKWTWIYERDKKPHKATILQIWRPHMATQDYKRWQKVI